MRQSMNKGAGPLEELWVGPWRSDQPDQFLSVPGELPEFPGLCPPEEIHAMWTEFPRKRWQERLTFISLQCFGKILIHDDFFLFCHHDIQLWLHFTVAYF